MQANFKEKKSIDIAYRIRQLYEKEEIRKIKAMNNLFYTPIDHAYLFLKQDDFYKDLSILKLALAIIFMIILYPFIFFLALIFNGWYLIKDKNQIKNRIKRVHLKYHSTYDVSEKKTFVQLWSDKGLRDYGFGFMEYGPYTYEEKFNCLSQWINILYDEKFDLNVLEKEITLKLNESQIEKSKINNDIRVPWDDKLELDIMPFIIDNVFFGYNNYKIRNSDFQ